MENKSHSCQDKHGHSQRRHNHHQMMIKDFKKRFFISIIFTVPVLLLSPLIQKVFGFEISFWADKYVLWV